MKKYLFAAALACLVLLTSCGTSRVRHTGDLTGSIYGVWALDSRNQVDYSGVHFYLSLSEPRIALAKKLLLDEEKHYLGRVRVSDLIAKVAPMFGLMGTLIPLAPGLIALGQGDTKTLSDSLLIAFDTTVAGLISAAVSLLISSVRKSWYAGYSSSLEAVMEAVLDVTGGDGNEDE